MQIGDKIVAIQPQRKERIQAYIDRLFDIEDKIESGELRDAEEVRKKTAKEILNSILELGSCTNNCDITWFVKTVTRKLKDEYGVEETE